MWYLIVNQESERYFIKAKDEEMVYFIKEDIEYVDEKTVEELKNDGFTIVGECFNSEMERLDILVSINKI